MDEYSTCTFIGTSKMTHSWNPRVFYPLHWFQLFESSVKPVGSDDENDMTATIR